MMTDTTVQTTPRMHTSVLRAAMFAFAVIAAVFASFTPTLAQDWQHSVAASVASPAAPTALSAARVLVERIGGIKSLEDRFFPTMADEAERLTKTDPVLNDAKFDAREMTLRLCKEHEDELIMDITRIYAAHLTIYEMRYLTAFFGSQTGARFLQFSRTLNANKNPDRRTASEEAATAIGLTPLEKGQIYSQIQAPAIKKYVDVEPIILAEVTDAEVKWGNKIGKEIMDAAIRERSSHSGQGAYRRSIPAVGIQCPCEAGCLPARQRLVMLGSRTSNSALQSSRRIASRA